MLRRENGYSISPPTELSPGKSANLPLRDYGRIARYPPVDVRFGRELNIRVVARDEGPTPLDHDMRRRSLKMSTARSGVTQELSTAYVREIFKNLESGDGQGFFDHVLDDVDWIVEGTHPLAGHYHSKAEFLAHTFEKLSKVLPKGAELYVENVLVSGDWAVVELRSDATAKNGLRFDNRYCWICRFVNGTIVEVRAYLDSALVARLFEENPI